MSRIVVLDFDKTLTRRDTALGFFFFCAPRGPLLPFRAFLFLATAVFTKLGVVSNAFLKDVGIRLFLAGSSRERLEAKAGAFAGTIELNPVVRDALRKEHAGDRVVIVTASLAVYVARVFPDLTVVASEIEYVDDHPARLARNCHGREKPRALAEHGIREIDIFYTDSVSDLPVARMSRRIRLVRGDRVSEYDTPEAFALAAGRW